MYARVIGLGGGSVITVPFDSHYAMQTRFLRETMEKAEERGIRVICVTANACSTATGTYDNLEEIGAFRQNKNTVSDVDAQDGLAPSRSKYRHLVRYITCPTPWCSTFTIRRQRPQLNTTWRFFRDGQRSYETFAQKAGYLFDRQDESEWYNGAEKTPAGKALGIVARHYQILRCSRSKRSKPVRPCWYDLRQTLSSRR
ncbi:MAG: pyridoxal-dependent decarboxylase [Bacteroidales bacterium]|nr:pyridoxal-dependent decarboxylase [Bacteroidales bacterium]